MPKEYIVTGNRNAVGRVYHSYALGSKVNETVAKTVIKPEHRVEVKAEQGVIYLNDECGIDSAAFRWVVVDYTEEGYSGSGEAVGLGKDGKLYVLGLSHCSCDGPGDSDSWTPVPDNWQDQFCDWSDELYTKVKELLAT